MKIEIKKTTKPNGDIFYAAYHEGETTFISGTCTFITSTRNDEQAIAEIEKAARNHLIEPIVETVKTIEI
jgi:hypothetical protein